MADTNMNTMDMQIETKKFDIFVSGKQTEKMAEEVSKYDANLIVAVNTPFNISNVPKWSEMKVKKINVPVFGLMIPRALSQVFDHPKYRVVLAAMNIPVPKMTFDSFVQKKGAQNIDELLTLEVCAKEVKFATFLRNFSKNLKELKAETITSSEDWSNFMYYCGFPLGWEKNLFFEDFLVMFGFTPENAEKFLEEKIVKIKNSQSKEVTIRDEYMNWVIKCTTCWRYEGCLTDFISWIFAAMNRDFADKKGKEAEEYVVKTINDFVSELNKECPNLVRFYRHFMDAETDDFYAACGMKMIEPSVDIFAQLPASVEEAEENAWKKALEKLTKYFEEKGIMIFWDNTKNSRQILVACKALGIC